MRFTRALVALVLALIWAAPAPATILFAGGEDLDFTIFGTVSVTTTAGHFRSAFSREGLTPSAVSGDPPANRLATPTFTANGTVWVHMEVFPASTTTQSNLQMAALYGSDGVRRLIIRGTGTASQIKISTRNTAGTITDLVTCTASWPASASLTKLDWFVNYAVSGHTTLYVNGVSLCDFAGDVTTNSVTQLNQADFGSPGTTTDWSEVIVSTTDTRDMNLFTCAPQANGTNQTWTGTASNVNPTTINDASSITTGTSNAIAEFTCPALPSGTYTVPAIVQSARVQIGTTGPQNFRYIARPSTGVTDFDSGSDILGSTAFTSYPAGQIWSTNPATSTIWTTGDLATGVNFGLKSRP